MPFREPEERKKYKHHYDANRRNQKRAVKVTLTWEQYHQFERAAKEGNLSVSRLMAELAEAQLHAEPFVDQATKEKLADIVRMLRSSGNAINEIAYDCKLHAHKMTPGDGIRLLSQIHQGILQMQHYVRNQFSSS